MRNIFLFINNNQYGPFSEEEVVQHIKTGKIPGDTFIWDNLLNRWLKITEIPKYYSLLELREQINHKNPEMIPNLGTLVNFSTEETEGHQKRFIRMNKMLGLSYCIIDPKTKQPLSDFRETVTLNISGSGLAFRETDAPITPGVFVDLRIKFPKIEHSFRIFGEVVRIIEIENGKAFDIGIKFIEMSESLQKHFLYYLQTLLLDAPDTK